MDFVDAFGRVWRPEVNARVVRDYEKNSGRGLLKGVSDVILENNADMQTEEDKQKIATAMIKIGMQIFENVGNVMFLLFEITQLSTSPLRDIYSFP